MFPTPLTQIRAAFGDLPKGFTMRVQRNAGRQPFCLPLDEAREFIAQALVRNIPIELERLRRGIIITRDGQQFALFAPYNIRVSGTSGDLTYPPVYCETSSVADNTKLPSFVGAVSIDGVECPCLFSRSTGKLFKPFPDATPLATIMD